MHQHIILCARATHYCEQAFWQSTRQASSACGTCTSPYWACFLLCAAAFRDRAGARKGTTVVWIINVLTRAMRACAACQCRLTVAKLGSPVAPATLTRQTQSVRTSSGILSAGTGQHASLLTTWDLSRTSTLAGQVRHTLCVLCGLSICLSTMPGKYQGLEPCTCKPA
jgi:hypothetical protein